MAPKVAIWRFESSALSPDNGVAAERGTANARHTGKTAPIMQLGRIKMYPPGASRAERTLALGSESGNGQALTIMSAVAKGSQ